MSDEELCDCHGRWILKIKNNDLYVHLIEGGTYSISNILNQATVLDTYDVALRVQKRLKSQLITEISWKTDEEDLGHVCYTVEQCIH